MSDTKLSILRILNYLYKHNSPIYKKSIKLLNENTIKRMENDFKKSPVSESQALNDLQQISYYQEESPQIFSDDINGIKSESENEIKSNNDNVVTNDDCVEIPSTHNNEEELLVSIFPQLQKEESLLTLSALIVYLPLSESGILLSMINKERQKELFKLSMSISYEVKSIVDEFRLFLIENLDVNSNKNNQHYHLLPLIEGVSSKERSSILEHLKLSDPQLTEWFEENIITFESILNFEVEDFSEIFNNLLDRNVLVGLCAYGDKVVIEKIENILTIRQFEILKEEISRFEFPKNEDQRLVDYNYVKSELVKITRKLLSEQKIKRGGA